MLVCQCNVINDRQIRQVILDLLREDPWRIIVPAMVYRELDLRFRCAGCVPNVIDITIKVTEEYHLQLAASPTEAPAPQRLVAMRRARQRGRNERRATGHRAPKRGAVS